MARQFKKFKIPEGIDLTSFGQLQFDWFLKQLWGEILPVDRVALVNRIKSLGVERAFVVEARMRRITFIVIADMTGVSQVRIQQLWLGSIFKLRQLAQSKFYKVPRDYYTPLEGSDDSRTEH